MLISKQLVSVVLQLDFPAKPKGQLQKENDEKFMKFMKEQKEKGQDRLLIIRYCTRIFTFFNT